MSKITPVLCFVGAGCAYFTTQPLVQQWGDDWDDAPARDADPPYYPDVQRGEDWWIVEIAFKGEFVGPDQIEQPLSVKDLNARKAPWLTHLKTVTKIYAGCTIEEFFEFMKRCGATCWPIGTKYECSHIDYWPLRGALEKALREYRKEDIVAQDPNHWSHVAEALLKREI